VKDLFKGSNSWLPITWLEHNRDGLVGLLTSYKQQGWWKVAGNKWETSPYISFALNFFLLIVPIQYPQFDTNEFGTRDESHRKVDAL